jgi:hypothetical protein
MLRRRLTFLFLGLVWTAAACGPTQPPTSGSVESAFEQHKSDVQVTGEGTVARILSDDTSGSPHQRFILKLKSGQTVLIEHNIDLAPRIDDLKLGDTVGYFGEYVWNEQGGLVHWTHHDPAGNHVGGWLKHNGRTYE